MISSPLIADEWDVIDINHQNDIVIVFKNHKTKEIKNHHVSKTEFTELIVDFINFKVMSHGNKNL